VCYAVNRRGIKALEGASDVVDWPEKFVEKSLAVCAAKTRCFFEAGFPENDKLVATYQFLYLSI
jgi:hypothetical protein